MWDPISIYQAYHQISNHSQSCDGNGDKIASRSTVCQTDPWSLIHECKMDLNDYMYLWSSNRSHKHVLVLAKLLRKLINSVYLLSFACIFQIPSSKHVLMEVTYVHDSNPPCWDPRGGERVATISQGVVSISDGTGGGQAGEPFPLASAKPMGSG